MLGGRRTLPHLSETLGLALADVLGDRRRRPPAQDDLDRRHAVIKVSVLYPRAEGATFDMDYYLGQHIPLVQEKLGTALKGVSVEQGVAGGAPDAPPTFVAMGHLLFDSVQAFQEAFSAHAEEIMGDIPNFTRIQPTIQISDVRL
jgi:uncharacterized protein (TIGR02118 family)